MSENMKCEDQENSIGEMLNKNRDGMKALYTELRKLEGWVDLQGDCEKPELDKEPQCLKEDVTFQGRKIRDCMGILCRINRELGA